jgi:transposase-like protein
MARQQGQDSLASSSTQVAVRGTRRRFTADYKAAIVQQAAQCRAPGEVGALLRREGLYSSHLTMWRKQYQAGVRRALSQRRGPTATRTAETATVARLARENAALRDALSRAELVITLQKKLAALLDHPVRDATIAPS